MGDLIVYDRLGISWRRVNVPDVGDALRIYANQGIPTVPVRKWREYGYRPWPLPSPDAGRLDRVAGNRSRRNVTRDGGTSTRF